MSKNQENNDLEMSDDSTSSSTSRVENIELAIYVSMDHLLNGANRSET